MNHLAPHFRVFGVTRAMGCVMSMDPAAHVAMRGYDPVSYFDGGPVMGDPAFSSTYESATYESATYYFASESNKTKFDANPERLGPQYGGWCAFAMSGMSEGKLFDVDPTRYQITDDGKLYMFYRGAGGDTFEKFHDDQPNRIAKADRIWRTHAYSQ